MAGKSAGYIWERWGLGMSGKIAGVFFNFDYLNIIVV